MVRKNWTNLNGLWEYKIADGTGKHPPDVSDGKILVPFPIESALSGVMKRVDPKQPLVYYRTFATPARTGGERVLLHFGAVDWACTVKVNETRVGEHRGGYDPFTFDITDALVAGDKQQVWVMVSDPTDTNWQPRGKQVNEPKGIWYTPTTGIWQTVWLEVVSASYLRTVTPTPKVDAKSVFVAYDAINAEGAVLRAVVRDGGAVVAEREAKIGTPLEVPIAAPKLWSPDSPHLYDVTVTLSVDGQPVDEVTSYFGMRKIALGKDKDGVTRLMLNGQPLFQYGTLDQGFWPDGLYTAPTDEALKYDLEVTKQLGFNMVRKHVKVEPARWYYHCDKLGLLVWQDMPSGDRHAPWNPTGGHNGKQIERTPESAENFKNEWREIMSDLRPFTCIVAWVPFNEAWGQFDTIGITKFTEELDPTRLVNCASGGNDFPVGHIVDLHRYPGPTIPKLEENRAAVLGEYGGLGLPLEGHTWQDKNNWGYRSFKTKEELASTYAQLIYKLRPLVGQGLSAAIYTQTTDVEVEVNGLMTYDREVIKFDPEAMAALHKKLYLPPPKEIVVLPTSREQAHEWRYTTTKPADGWEKPDFDDSSWSTGPGGFGEPSTPGSKVRTPWKTPDIWLRRTVKLPTASGKPPGDGTALAIHHDEDSEIYLNGTLIAAVKGYTTDYTVVPLDEKTLAAAWKDGDNILAVHCHQTGGGQYIDIGLVRLEEARK
jgi:beta-galactosidase/beta-glucuronidase